MPSQADVAARSLTVHWDDPMIGASAAKELSGLEYLREMAEGRIAPPPVAKLLGFHFVRADQGEVEFSFLPHESHFNPIGSVHGGVISTLLDSAMGCSVHSLLPRGKAYTTLELKINFVRAVLPANGKLLCRGKVIHAGGRMATAEGHLQDEAGKLYAHATTTCMIFDTRAS